MEHEQLLTHFFTKHPQTFNIMTALKVIEKKLECAKKSHKKDKASKEYLKYLKEAATMISDLFMELGEDHSQY